MLPSVYINPDEVVDVNVGEYDKEFQRLQDKIEDLRDDKAKTDVEIEKITRQLHDQVERNEEIRKQLKAAAEN